MLSIERSDKGFRQHLTSREPSSSAGGSSPAISLDSWHDLSKNPAGSEGHPYAEHVVGREERSPIMNILTVVGTRPEAIKMAPLIIRLRENPGFRVTVCSTGQHREMIRQAFAIFEISPDVDLEIMRPHQQLGAMTASALTGVESVLAEVHPDRVLVQGDTTTAFAATLAAYYHKIPVGHVEAGLRSGNAYAPWPEEINRKLTDAIADRLFAPTETARNNLRREGAKEQNIVVTGNTVIDALLDVVRGPIARPEIQARMVKTFAFLRLQRKTILVTCHRRESFGDGFRQICSALKVLASRPDVQIVFPMHRNPNVRAVFSSLAGLDNVCLIDPLDYLEFVYLMTKCAFILTDSGGIQEEAPSLGKPVLVLRDVTERSEAVFAGTVRLVGTETNAILGAAYELLDDSSAYLAMSTAHNPYGDGKACRRIIASLQRDG